jgi:hypothetical protein
MPRLFGRRFPIQLRNQRGQIVASVQRGQDTLRIVTGSSPVDLRPLDGLEGLRHVELTGGSKWGINAPEAILPASLPDLRALIVRGKIANQEVVPTFKRLETLWTGVFTTWPDIAWVRELVDLEHLHLRLAHKVDDVTAVADLPRLRKLGLEGAYWADLTPVGRQTNLIELVLDYPRKGLHHLKRLTNLERLDLLELQSKHLSMVAGMTKLRELRVLGGAADISALKDLRQLELLILRRTRIDNDALANVSDLVNLHELSLMHVSRVTDISPIGHLSQLNDLNLFEMTGPLKSLRPLADCTELESVDAGLTEVDDQDLSFLYELPRLKRFPRPSTPHRRRRRSSGASAIASSLCEWHPGARLGSAAGA